MSNVEKTTKAHPEVYTIGSRGGVTVDTFVYVNYLAHFYLADPEVDLMFGNYIGDGIRGRNLSAYSDPVQRGVHFHRFIDTYTDTHAVVSEAKRIFYPTQGKFSGVVVDVLFDHLLAKNWLQYSEIDLEQFAKSCYSQMQQFNEPMPERSARFFHYMLRENILVQYKNTEGVNRVFRGMDSRTRFESNMHQSVEDMRKNEREFESLFHDFFPELVEACTNWKATH